MGLQIFLTSMQYWSAMAYPWGKYPGLGGRLPYHSSFKTLKNWLCSLGQGVLMHLLQIPNIEKKKIVITEKQYLN